MARAHPSQPENLTLGDRLRIARKTRKLSAAQLAQKVAISPSYVQKLESGVRKASPSLILALAKALSASLSNRVATARNCLRRQRQRSTKLRAL
ncbi:helix-turn-helix domain-containing protein [Streptomyces sp. NPDC056452]|uniref:helix-turn-helix domain-containing protein n=1 Tax=Streptomyces sp. NPDC056452 TaxID=3345821 RepID=UPI003686E247